MVIDNAIENKVGEQNTQSCECEKRRKKEKIKKRNRKYRNLETLQLSFLAHNFFFLKFNNYISLSNFFRPFMF